LAKIGGRIASGDDNVAENLARRVPLAKLLTQRRMMTMNPGAQPLTISDHENFAQAHVRLGTATAAYREVYDPEGLVPNTTAWERGCKLAARPDVSARYRWLRGEALAQSQVKVVALIDDLYDIATADPNELARSLVVNCRHCHGDGHEYQWIDVHEFEAAVAKIERENEGRKRQKALPEIGGGFGFVLMRDPNPMCPACCGAGEMHVIIADTTKLSPKAAKLFKGIKVKGNGDREVLMHDQLAARDQLHRLTGAYKDSLSIPIPPTGEVKPGADVHRTYLTMIGGGKRA
jgi:phage terminase small subunit